MLKKFISLLLCLMVLGNLPLLASTKQTKEEKLKTQIAGLGVGKNVTTTLTSGEKLDGLISEIKDTAFTVQVLKDGKTSNREVSYTEINKVSEKAPANKSKKMPGRVSIGLIVGLVVVAAVATTAYIKNDRGF